MALTLPAAPSPRPRRWWPSFSFARLRAAAKTAAAMPLGSQQLRRQRTSTLLSLAGVTASLLVIFAQLGIERAVYEFGDPPPSLGPGRPRAGAARLQVAAAPCRGAGRHDRHRREPIRSVAGTAPLWFGIMSISHAGMPTARRLAWYAIDVERPAIDVPGLRDNLYKLRVTRRILFDRDSRPYFGDLAEVVERGEEVPIAGPARQSPAPARDVRGRHGRDRAERRERRRGRDVGRAPWPRCSAPGRRIVRPSSASSSCRAPIRSPRATS